MRSHGVPNFPEPDSQGAIWIEPKDGIDPDTPEYQAAYTACQDLA
jgi:hypothetical protein